MCHKVPLIKHFITLRQTLDSEKSDWDSIFWRSCSPWTPYFRGTWCNNWDSGYNTSQQYFSKMVSAITVASHIWLSTSNRVYITMTYHIHSLVLLWTKFHLHYLKFPVTHSRMYCQIAVGFFLWKILTDLWIIFSIRNVCNVLVASAMDAMCLWGHHGKIKLFYFYVKALRILSVIDIHSFCVSHLQVSL